MAQHAASRIVPLPLNQVELRLRDVESWSTFLEGVGSIRFVSPERYVFTLSNGRDHQELKMVVRLRYRDRSYVWHGLGGPQGSVLRGSLSLESIDEDRTSVTLSRFSYPADFRSGVAELLMPQHDRGFVDLHLLERFLVAGPGSDAGSQARSDAEWPRDRHNPAVPEQLSTYRRSSPE